MKMIAHTHNNRLTLSPLVDILTVLSPSLVAVRGGSRKNQQMPIQARLIMDCVIKCSKFYGGRYLGSFGSRGSVATSTNLNNVHRPKFGSFKRCPLSPHNRVHTMSQNKSVQQTTAQTEQAIKAALLAQLQKDIDSMNNTLSTQHLVRFHKDLNQTQVVHDYLSKNLNNNLISFSGFQQIIDTNLCCLQVIRDRISRETNSHKKTHS
jgi:hypothetical protein